MARSSIEALPESVRDELDRLVREGVTIDQIVAHLQELGQPVSRSAVGRYRKSMMDRMERYREAQEVAGVWVQSLGEDPKGDVGRLLAEMLKTVAFQTLSELGEGESVEPKDLMFLARSIKDMEGASTIALEREKQLKQAALEAAARKAETAVQARGLSARDAREIRAQILGVELGE